MGLLNDIPAEYAENLEVGHRLNVQLDEEVVVTVGLEKVTLTRGYDVVSELSDVAVHGFVSTP